MNDWRREDRFGNGKRVEDGRLSDGDSKTGGRSPEQPNDLDASSPPMIRPVRDILGENISPLRVIEPPKGSGSIKVADSSVHKQVSFFLFFSIFHIHFNSICCTLISLSKYRFHSFLCLSAISFHQ